MNKKIMITAILGVFAVGIGAFGAHGLKPNLDAQQIDTFKTASMYHFIHLLAMMMIAFTDKNQDKYLNQSFYLFLAGIIAFSGSLYILSTKHLYGGDAWNIVGPITPIGGVLFILAWANLIRYQKKKFT